MAIEIYPVVHLVDEQTAAAQSAAAFEAGADGVYIIDHLSRDHQTATILDTYNAVRRDFPDNFIGLNILHESPTASLQLFKRALDAGSITTMPSGLWVDNGKWINESTLKLREKVPALAAVRLLGGAAFKYTREFTHDPDAAAGQALALSPSVDVVTTSGQGTGFAPTRAKIAAMKQAIGTQPLAIASGVSAENIADYVGDFDQLLVASSIETEPYSGIFDVAKLRALVDTAHQL